MNYHNLEHDSIMNGDGLRVVLFISGCNHFCEGCQNPQTWELNSGILFDKKAIVEIYEQLDKSYISGITFSGGDPLHQNNRQDVLNLILSIKQKYTDKTIWLYTGYTWEQIINNKELFEICSNCDVVVDGEYKKDLSDIKYHWAGSTNQRVIDVKNTIKGGKIILWEK